MGATQTCQNGHARRISGKPHPCTCTMVQAASTNAAATGQWTHYARGWSTCTRSTIHHQPLGLCCDIGCAKDSRGVHRCSMHLSQPHANLLGSIPGLHAMQCRPRARWLHLQLMHWTVRYCHAHQLPWSMPLLQCPSPSERHLHTASGASLARSWAPSWASSWAALRVP